jgi:hypothetical protein
MHSYKGKDLGYTAIPSACSVNVEEVINGSKASGKQHDANGCPRKTTFPVKSIGNDGNGEYNKNATHDWGLCFDCVCVGVCKFYLRAFNYFVLVEEVA